ncbi:MAG TPA: EAL domain-containing protein [Micromonosporaceae bacterium]|nr:EAL domain-containing protein [Micromonosporaceae bacterium]
MTATYAQAIGAAVAVAGVAGAAVTASAAAAAPRSTRVPWLLGITGPLALAASVVTATWVLPPDGPAARVAVAAGIAAYGGATLYAMLIVAAGTERGGTAVRRGTDGVLIGSCMAFLVWSLGPGVSGAGAAAPGTPGPVAMTLLVTPALLVVGVCLAVTYATRRSRPRLASTAVALASIAGCGVATLFSVGSRGPLALAVSVALGCCVVVTAVLLRGVHGERVWRDRIPRHPGLVVWVAAGFALAAAVAHTFVYHHLDDPGVIVATVVVGGAFGVRQALAMRDVRTQAMQLARREARFRVLANTDPLTGLANRRAFEDVLAQHVGDGGPGVLLLLDLDGFKRVNDVRGHEAGDAVLVEVARRLEASVRAEDVVARLGGDEFGVLLWMREQEAVAIATRLRTVLSAPYLVGGAAVAVSASIGFAEAGRITDPAELTRQADLALRFAKQHGKDRVIGYDAAYGRWLQRRTVVAEGLDGAIAGDGLSMVYQPVVSLPEGRILGAEALPRWQHPMLGTVPPAEILQIAEDTGTIDTLGRWMLREACGQLARWLTDGYDIWLGVHVSARELHRPGYVADVVQTMHAHKLPAERLVVEVSEHAVAVETAALAVPLAALREVGVRVALDEVGAGYSALGRLGSVPADMLKISESLVRAPAPSPDRPAGPLVDVLAMLGERLQIDVVAAGVNTMGQRLVAEAAGCLRAQGELFGRPVPADQLATRLAAQFEVPRPRQPYATAPARGGCVPGRVG